MSAEKGKRYWDDIRIGDKLDCEPFTMSQDEIIEFASKYDPQCFHINPEIAVNTRFGGIIASSLHTLSLCTRAIVDAMIGFEVIIGLGINILILKNVVRPGDHLALDACWSDLRRSSSKPEQGVAALKFSLFNQKSELVLAAEYTYLLACRSGGPSA